MAVTSETKKLLERTAKVVSASKQRAADAENPEPTWAKFYAAERIEEMLSKKRREAAEENSRELSGLLKDMTAEISEYHYQIDKGLRPLQTSDKQGERQEGGQLEERAYRFVKAVGTLGIEEEWNRAIRAKSIDFASDLVRWAEVFADPNEIGETRFVEHMNARHREELGLSQYTESIQKLEAILPSVEAWQASFSSERNPFSHANTNLTEQVMLTRIDTELSNSVYS